MKTTYDSVRLDTLLGSIGPDHFYQNEVTGKSNILSAKATTSYLYVQGFDYWNNSWQESLFSEIAQFNEESDHIYVSAKSTLEWTVSLSAEKVNDKALISVAGILCTAYIFCFLGSWSPIHCRVGMSLVGLFCIALSIDAGKGLCYFLGLHKNDIQDTIPFLMLGIGVDDIFVLCNALD